MTWENSRKNICILQADMADNMKWKKIDNCRHFAHSYPDLSYTDLVDFFESFCQAEHKSSCCINLSA